MVFKKGCKSWNKGLTKETSELVLKSSKNMKGIPKTQEHKEKLRKANIGKKYSKETNNKKSCPKEKNGNYGKRGEGTSNFGRFGDLSYSWKGGKSPLISLIRYSTKTGIWRTSVFERDQYTCKECGDNSGGNLEAHHIKKLTNIIREFNITTIEEAYDCNFLWDLNNGITLCKTCHKKTNNYGNKINK